MLKVREIHTAKLKKSQHVDQGLLWNSFVYRTHTINNEDCISKENSWVDIILIFKYGSPVLDHNCLQAFHVEKPCWLQLEFYSEDAWQCSPFNKGTGHITLAFFPSWENSLLAFSPSAYCLVLDKFYSVLYYQRVITKNMWLNQVLVLQTKNQFHVLTLIKLHVFWYSDCQD